MMKQVRANGVNLNVLDEGQGSPIVFVHGFPLDHSMWRKQIDEFAATHRVIAPDLRGFGASEGTNGTVLMETFADDVAATLDELQVVEPVVLCGLSMGGYVGWQFFLRHRARLCALIQCDTRAIADDETGVANRQKLARLVRENGTAPVASAMLPNLFSSTGDVQSLVEETRAVIERTNPEAVAAAALGLAARPDITDQLGDIDVPTLLIVGTDDKISPAEEMQGIAKRIPHATCVVVPDAGHMAPLENAEFTNRAIREFLSR
jgi:3-oxoadipate enol-lactonase